MMRKKNVDAAWRKTFRKMPPLHRKKGESYDVAQDDVFLWASSKPEIVNSMIDKASYEGLIVFDPVTRTWRGCDR